MHFGDRAAVTSPRMGKVDIDERTEAGLKKSKVYHKVGLALAANGITLRNGVFTTQEDLEEAGVAESSSYQQAHDVRHGRADSVISLGSGVVTFNDTQYNLPWDPQNFRIISYTDGEPNVDLTSYTNSFGWQSRKPDKPGLRPPLVMLREVGKKSREFPDRFPDENHPETAEIDPNEYAHSWEKGSIDTVPGLSSPEEAVAILGEVTDIEDVAMKYKLSPDHVITVYDPDPITSPREIERNNWKQKADREI